MSDTEMTIKIGIIGAGPAGLTAALALESYVPHANLDMTLFDKNATPYDYPGVEYGIQKRACQALDRIGLKEQALQRGVKAHTIQFYNSRTGRWFRPVSSDPENTRCVVRQEFLSDLMDLVSTTTVKMKHRVIDITSLPDGSMQIKTIDPEGNRDKCVFDVVIACDGSFSTTRRLFFPESAEKTDQGFSCIYMLLDAQDPTAAAARYLEMANGGTSQLIMGTHSTLALFPLGKNRLAYGIGFDHKTKDRLWADHDLSTDEKWPDIPAGKRHQIAAALVQDACPHDPVYLTALDYVDDWGSYKIYLWQMKDTDPLLTPSLDQGNLILIGDAAHAMLPTIGMGASLAIEDGEMLGKQIAQAIKKHPNPADLRARFKNSIATPYAKSRVPVWQDLMSRARLAARENFIDQASKKRFASGPAIPNPVVSKIVSTIERILRRFD